MPINTPSVPKQQAGRTPSIAPQSRRRSAVTNGTRLFIEGDEEGPWARRFRDLYALHLADLGPSETLSEAQISLCRRVATMEAELEQIEARMSRGEEVSLDIYQRTANSLTRILKTLGIERKQKPVQHWRDKAKDYTP